MSSGWKTFARPQVFLPPQGCCTCWETHIRSAFMMTITNLQSNTINHEDPSIYRFSAPGRPGHQLLPESYTWLFKPADPVYRQPPSDSQGYCNGDQPRRC